MGDSLVSMAKTDIGIFEKLAELGKLQKQAVRFLLNERRAIDRKLVKLGHAVGIGTKRRVTKARVCKVCGKTGHNARSHKKGAAKAATV